jgi:hypothetical protein
MEKETPLATTGTPHRPTPPLSEASLPAALLAALTTLAGCGAPSDASEPPELRQGGPALDAAEPPPEPEDGARAGGIAGAVVNAQTNEPLRGATVCADTGVVSRCGQTDALGRYRLEPLIGFSAADLVFIADGHPVAQAHVELSSGSAWYYARLPSEAEVHRFNQRLDERDRLGPGGVLVRAEGIAVGPSEAAIDATFASLQADGTLDAGRSATVLYAGEDGQADLERTSISAAGLAGIVLAQPAWVELTVDPAGPCRFRGGLTTRVAVLADPSTLALVAVACAEGLRDP